jgi:Na+/melibiose symporter-like transporter
MNTPGTNLDKADIGEMIAYGGAHFATTILPAFAAYHLMWYCTDVALVPAFAVSMMLMSLRLFGAFYVNFVGLFMNCTQFKDGKYRPYFKWCAIPLAIALALLCTMPVTNLVWKIAWLTVILLACEILNSILSIASLAMLPHLAKNDVDRTKYVSFFITFSILAFLVVGSFLRPAAWFLGDGDWRVGFPMVMALLAILVVPLSFNAWFRLKERYFHAPVHQPALRDLITIILRNRRILLFMAAYAIYVTGNGFKTTTTVYYFSCNLGCPEMLPTVFLAGLIAPLLMQPVMPRLLTLARKETLIVFGLLGATCTCFLIAIAGDNMMGLIVCFVLYGLFTAISANLVFAVMASLSDEIRESTSIQMSDVLSATMRFSDRIGMAISFGVAPMVLAICGYVPLSTEQTPTALAGIKALFIFFTAGGLILAGVFMLVFRAMRRENHLRNTR